MLSTKFAPGLGRPLAFGLATTLGLLLLPGVAAAFPCGDLAGTKFEDTNGNGVRDAGEPGMAGWTIRVVSGQTGVGVDAITDPNGDWSLSGVDCGIHTVFELTQPGYVQTRPPAPGYYLITMELGQAYTGLDFGNQPSAGGCPPVDLDVNLATGWDDANQSLYPLGTVDTDWLTTYSEEPVSPPLPRSPHAVTYFPSWPNLLDPTLSQYLSIDLNGRNGEYTYQRCFCLDSDFQNPQLQFDITVDDEAEIFLNGLSIGATLSTGFTTVSSFNVTDPALFQPGVNCLSVATQNTGRVVTGFNINGSLTADNGECCLPPPAELSGEKFYDPDGDGVFTAGVDYYLDGQVFTLSDGSSTSWPTQSSGQGGPGQFGWSGLPAGTYTVTEPNLLPGWSATANGASQSTTLAAGGSDHLLFGNVGPLCETVDVIEAFAEGCCISAGADITLHDYFTGIRAVATSGTFDVPLMSAALNNNWVLVTASPTLFEWFYDPAGSSPQPIPAGNASPGVLCFEADGNQAIADIQLIGPDGSTVECSAPTEVFCDPFWGSLTIVKFQDLDGDGLPSSNEVLPGWFFTATGNSTYSGVTDANGNVVIGGVEPGTYTVCESPQVGWQPVGTGPCQTVTVQSDTNTVVTFQNESICDVDVEIVETGDCCYELFAYNNNGAVFGSVSMHTNQPASFLSADPISPFQQQPFAGGAAPAGTLDVSWDLAGASLPQGGSHVSEFCLDGGGVDPIFAVFSFNNDDGSQVCFDSAPLQCDPDNGGGGNGGQITGSKFHDIDGNGVWDAGEPGLGGWTIQLTDPNGNIISTTTNPDGSYSFDNVAAGAYSVSEVQQSGWEQTFPDSGVWTVLLADGQVAGGFDFGNTEVCLSVVDDEIACGQLTPYIYSFTLTNLSPFVASELVFDDITPAGVSFNANPVVFSGGLNPGDSTQVLVSIDGPDAVAGTEVCFDLLIHDEDTDECCGVGEQQRRCITLPECEECSNHIQGQKFRDRNANGDKDPNEPGLANWTIVLTDSFGFSVSTTTDNGGVYHFADLPDGTYTVSEVQQFNWVQTVPPPPGDYTITLVDGELVSGVDFGNTRRAIAVLGLRESSAERVADNRTQPRRLAEVERLRVPQTLPTGARRVSMLRLTATAGEAEDLLLRELTLQASGSGHDLADLEAVRLFVDVNGNGQADAGEPELATGAYSSDDGISVLSLAEPLRIEATTAQQLLVVYDFVPASVGLEVHKGAASWPLAAMLLLLLSLGLCSQTRRRELWALLPALALCFSLNACAGGESSTGAPSYQATLVEIDVTGADSGQEVNADHALPLSGPMVQLSE